MKVWRLMPEITLGLFLFGFTGVSGANEFHNDNPNSTKLVTVIVNKAEQTELCSMNKCGQEHPVFIIGLDGEPVAVENLVSVTYFKGYGEKISSQNVLSVVSQRNVSPNGLIPVEEDIEWKSITLENHHVSSFCMALWSKGVGECKGFNELGNGRTEVTYWEIEGQGPVPEDPKPGGIRK